MTSVRRAFAVAELVESGTTRADLRAQVRAGSLTSLRHGVVADDRYDGPDAREHRYRDLVIATCKRGGDPLASHLSAAALHRLPIVGGDLSVVHTTAARRSGGQRRGGVHRHPAHRDDFAVTIDGVRVTSLLRTLTDVARTEEWRTSVPVLDAALHQQLVTTELLLDELAPPRRLHGLARARRAVRLADGRSESPGESLTRLDLHLAGMTDLEPQIDLADGDGRWLARVDLWIRRAAVAVEFDGALKYGGAPRMPDARAALIGEKQREDALRRAGVTIVRIVWSDLSAVGRVENLVRDAVGRGLRARSAGAVSVVELQR